MSFLESTHLGFSLRNQDNELGITPITIWYIICSLEGSRRTGFHAEHLVPESSKLYKDIPNEVAEDNTIDEEQAW